MASPLDGFDLKILAALQRDGRLTNQQLSEQVALSASQCSRRRLALEDAGVIRGYHAEVAPEALGLNILAFIQVTLAAHTRNNARLFRDMIHRQPAVLEAHALTGDSDYLVKVVLADLGELAAFVNETLLAHESVARVSSSIVLDRIKDGSVLSPSLSPGLR